MRLDEYGNVILDEDLNQGSSTQVQQRSHTTNHNTPSSSYTYSRSRSRSSSLGWIVGIIVAILVFILMIAGSKSSTSSSPSIDYLEQHGDSISSIGSVYSDAFASDVPQGVNVQYLGLQRDAYVGSTTDGTDLSGIDTLEFELSGTIQGVIILDGSYFEESGVWYVYGVNCDFYNLSERSAQINAASEICGFLANRFYGVRKGKAQYEVKDELESWDLGSGTGGWSDFLFEHGLSKTLSLETSKVKGYLYAMKGAYNTVRFTVYKTSS